MYVFRAFIALFAILLGTTSTAQDATNTMTRLIPFSPVGLHVDAAQNLAPVA
jgi:uncharacterized protein YigE (DUF2233 family)